MRRWGFLFPLFAALWLNGAELVESSGRCLAEYWFDVSANLRLERYETRSSAPSALWFHGDTPLGEGTAWNVLRRSDSAPVAAAPSDAPNKRLPADEPVSESGRPEDLPLAFTMDVPDVLYDDVPRALAWRVSGRLPLDLHGRVQVIGERDGKRLFETVDDFVLTSVPTGGNAFVFSSRRGVIRLTEELLRGGLTLRVGFSVSGMVFPEIRRDFVPVANLSSLRSDSDGHFYDDNGTRLVVVLHRRGVSESRTFELARWLKRFCLVGRRRILVVAEDGGAEQNGLSARLTAKAETKGHFLQFQPWRQGGNPDAWNDFGKVWRAVRRSAVECVLIVVPPENRRFSSRGIAEQAYLLELLEQSAWCNPDVRRVVLTSPLPEESSSNSVLCRQLRRDLRGADSVFWELEERAKSAGTATERIAELILEAALAAPHRN